MKTLLLFLLSAFALFLNIFTANAEDQWTVYEKRQAVRALAVEGESIWIGYVGGVIKQYKPVNQKMFYNVKNSGLPNDWIRSMAIDSEGNKWFGTLIGGAAKFDDTDWTVYNTSNSGLPDVYVRSIAIDWDGNTWFGTSNGAAKFDGTDWTVYDEENSGLPDNDVYSLAIDSSGNLWFATGRGASKFDGTNWTVYNEENSGLPYNGVGSIAIDKDGNKWFGFGNGRGAVKFDGTDWTVYNTSNSDLPDNRVYSMAIDRDGNIWFGTKMGGAAKFDGTDWTVYNSSNSGLPENLVHSIAIDGDGDKWFGTAESGVAMLKENATPVNVQQTYVPDDNFEQVLIDLGYDEGPLNDSVPTRKIDKVTVLEVQSEHIADLTGIEDFIALENLNCSLNDITSLDLSKNSVLEYLHYTGNNLTSIDVSNNPALTLLYCSSNNLTSIDVSNNPALTIMSCSANNILSLDLSNNPSLQKLYCNENELTSLDLSNNPVLRLLYCSSNNLTSLDVSNKIMFDVPFLDTNFSANNNPYLYCIQVDDSARSANAEGWYKDDQAHYSEDCGYTGVEENIAKTNIFVYPNPTSSFVNIESEMPLPSTYRLINIFGELVQTGEIDQKSLKTDIYSETASFDTSRLPDGIYFIQMNYGDEIISKKFIVLR